MTSALAGTVTHPNASARAIVATPNFGVGTFSQRALIRDGADAAADFMVNDTQNPTFFLLSIDLSARMTAHSSRSSEHSKFIV